MWQKLVVLGSQKLWELRDAIVCPSDEKLNSARLRMSRPSAFFYIEGVFYNDMRHPDAIDISEPIRKFCDVAALDAPHPPPPTPFADPPVETNVEGVCSVQSPRIHHPHTNTHACTRAQHAHTPTCSRACVHTPTHTYTHAYPHTHADSSH